MGKLKYGLHCQERSSLSTETCWEPLEYGHITSATRKHLATYKYTTHVVIIFLWIFVVCCLHLYSLKEFGSEQWFCWVWPGLPDQSNVWRQRAALHTWVSLSKLAHAVGRCYHPAADTYTSTESLHLHESTIYIAMGSWKQQEFPWLQVGLHGRIRGAGWLGASSVWLCKVAVGGQRIPSLPVSKCLWQCDTGQCTIHGSQRTPAFTVISHLQRIDCGYLGIQEFDCIGKVLILCTKIRNTLIAFIHTTW